MGIKAETVTLKWNIFGLIFLKTGSLLLAQ